MRPNPTLIQIHTRDWLRRLSSIARQPLMLDQVPRTELARLADAGFVWLYLLGIWQTGAVGKEISRTNQAWFPGYHDALADFSLEDVCGSPFAVSDYHVHRDFGGDDGLARFRELASSVGLRLMLDFVPNHLAIDHPWVENRPEWFVQGLPADPVREPLNYFKHGDHVFAHGRDPYFPGWADTIQLDYSNPELASAMQAELERISKQCDGVRCDMAMLILPEIFERTWGRTAVPFWPQTSTSIRQQAPNFVFCAEVYWGLEWQLQQLGFDFTYDKTLYDRLCHGDAGAVRGHLLADIGFQRRLARFLENHDEPRAAGELPWPKQQAAALIAFTIPGLRFFHEGQLTGARRKPSIHLRRRADEPVDEAIAHFYQELLKALRSGLAQGEWKRFEACSAWQGNASWEAMVVHGWERGGKLADVVAVNFSGHASQAYVPLSGLPGDGEMLHLVDQISSAEYTRNRASLSRPGLYLDLPPWGGYFFSVRGM